KRRSELHAAPVNGTLGAVSVFPSPDGKWLGFVAGGKLKKVPVSGGDAVTLGDAQCYGAACDEMFEGGGAWLEDGHILFRSRDALVMISENGGAVDTMVTSRSVSGLSPLHPNAVPGRHAVVFTSCTLSCNKAYANVVD